MTLTDLLTACRQVGIVLNTTGEYIDIDAPESALTPELREALCQHKSDLLQVLWRLRGMRQHRNPVPTAKSVTEAPGGPGRCFSCGGRLDHPQAYGRCTWCCIAADVFYSERGHTESDRPLVAAMTARERDR